MRPPIVLQWWLCRPVPRHAQRSGPRAQKVVTFHERTMMGSHMRTHRLAELRHLAHFSTSLTAGLLREVLSVPECVPLVASNPSLRDAALRCVVSICLRRSRLTPGEASQAAVDALTLISARGDLIDFPWAISELLRRVDVPGGYKGWPWALNARNATSVLLAAPELPAEVLIDLDLRLARHVSLYGARRVEVAQHASATILVWRAMLVHGRAPSIVRVMWESPLTKSDQAFYATLRGREI